MGTKIRTCAASAACALMGAQMAFADAVDTPHFRIMGLAVVWGADAADPGAGVPIVSDFVIDSGAGNSAATSGDADLIAGDVHTLITGSLTPVSNSWSGAHGAPMILRRLQGQPNIRTDSNGDGVMNDEDGFGAFRLRQNSDTNTRRMEITSSFYVASNTAFSIDAVATPLNGTTTADLARVRVQLRTEQSGNDGLPFGGASQFPHSAGAAGGSQANNRRLSTLVPGRRVFRGDQRTAAVRGTLSEQSVRFDLRYRYGSGNIDLSDGAFEVEAEVVYTVYVP